MQKRLLRPQVLVICFGLIVIAILTAYLGTTVDSGEGLYTIAGTCVGALATLALQLAEKDS